MITYQREKDDYNPLSQHYIYIYGGIRIVDFWDKLLMNEAD